jgi:5'-deoxynucleotidase YfbR-like HD superfamily hydrolase
MKPAIGTPENCNLLPPLGACCLQPNGHEAIYLGEDTGWQYTYNRELHLAINTSSGRLFWPLNPLPDEVYIEDIAHGLAAENRFGNQADYPYSVAWHSVALSHVVPQELARWALMHDAAEAYMADIPRPLKRTGKFEFYEKAEKELMKIIATEIGLTPTVMPKELEEYDSRMGSVELLYANKVGRAKMIARGWSHEELESYSNWKDWIKPVSFEDAKKAFLDRYNQLFK